MGRTRYNELCSREQCQVNASFHLLALQVNAWMASPGMGTVINSAQVNKEKLPAAFVKPRFDGKNCGAHQIKNSFSCITKHLIYAVNFKSRSYRINKHPLKKDRKVKKRELYYIFCHYQMFHSYLNNIKFESYPYSF